MITVDMILQLKPCWSAPFIERALKKADCTSWVGLFTSAREDGWKTCSLKDMHWLLVNYAAIRCPETFRAWANATYKRVSPQTTSGAVARMAQAYACDRMAQDSPELVSALLDLARRLDEARRTHD